MAFENLQLETSGGGGKVTREEVQTVERQVSDIEAHIQNIESSGNQKIREKLQNSNIKNEVYLFLQNAANNTQAGHLSEYNAQKFDTDGEQGLDKFEFGNFQKALEVAVRQIIILDGQKAFDAAHKKSEETVKDSTELGWKDAMNPLKVGGKGLHKFGETVAESLPADFTFGNYSPEELQAMKDKPVSLSLESAKEIAILAGIEIGEGVKDIIKMVFNVPLAITLLPTYLKLRVEANSSDEKIATAAEIQIKELTNEHKALALCDLLGEKGVEMIKQLFSMLTSGKQGDIATMIVTIAGLIAGGAGAVKLGAKVAGLGRVEKFAGKVQRAAGAADDVISGTAAIGKAGEMVGKAIGGVKKVSSAPASPDSLSSTGKLEEAPKTAIPNGNSSPKLSPSAGSPAAQFGYIGTGRPKIKPIESPISRNYKIGEKVQIERTDGRRHEAIIDRYENGDAIVKWHENGEWKEKAVTPKQIDALNSPAARVQSKQEEVSFFQNEIQNTNTRIQQRKVELSRLQKEIEELYNTNSGEFQRQRVAGNLYTWKPKTGSFIEKKWNELQMQKGKLEEQIDGDMRYLGDSQGYYQRSLNEFDQIQEAQRVEKMTPTQKLQYEKKQLKADIRNRETRNWAGTPAQHEIWKRELAEQKVRLAEIEAQLFPGKEGKKKGEELVAMGKKMLEKGKQLLVQRQLRSAKIGDVVVPKKGDIISEIIAIEGNTLHLRFMHEGQYHTEIIDINNPPKWIKSIETPIPEGKPTLETFVNRRSIRELPAKRNREILGRDNFDNLNKSAQRYKTDHGSEIVAGSDKGVGYKDHNEDRVVVDPQNEFVADIDGMGGMGSGDKAADILAEELAKDQDNPNLAVDRASKRIAQELGKGPGAAFVSGRVVREHGKIFVDEFHAGDCQMLIIRKGKVIFVSKQDSLVSGLEASGDITSDQALYHPDRNIVTGGVSGDMANVKGQRVEVQSGDRVLLMSDGISDNLTPAEIAREIEGLTPEQVMKRISDITDQRMQNFSQLLKDTSPEKRARVGKYSDGYKSEPKKDNRSLIVMDIAS